MYLIIIYIFYIIFTMISSFHINRLNHPFLLNLHTYKIHLLHFRLYLHLLLQFCQILFFYIEVFFKWDRIRIKLLILIQIEKLLFIHPLQDYYAPIYIHFGILNIDHVCNLQMKNHIFIIEQFFFLLHLYPSNQLIILFKMHRKLFQLNLKRVLLELLYFPYFLQLFIQLFFHLLFQLQEILKYQRILIKSD